MEKQKLISEVVHQIELDIREGDYSVLYELLEKLDEKYLESYLPEENY